LLNHSYTINYLLSTKVYVLWKDLLQTTRLGMRRYMSMDQRRLSQYELQELLESDHLTELWKAFDTQQRRYVTLKILQIPQGAMGDFAPKFLAENQKLSSLQHPNIAQVVDAQIVTNTQGNNACIVTEYVEGQLLTDFMKGTVHTGNFLDASELITLLNGLGSAIDYVHQRGIIHGAIQPSNIILDKQNTSSHSVGGAKLLGFGMQHFIPAQVLPLEATQYISPERAQGRNENLRSDIYALGVLLYELSTGALPFEGETPEEILIQQAQATPISPASINPRIRPALTAVIMRSLAKDPANRFPTALSLVGAAARALQVSNKDFPSLLSLTPSLTPSNISGILSQPSESMYGQTYLTPTQQASGAYPAVSPENYATIQTPPFRGQTGAQAQPSGAYQTVNARQAQPYPPPETVSQTPPGIIGTPIQTKGGWRPGKLSTALILLLILAVLGISVGGYLLTHKPSQPQAVATPSIGEIFFVSSGQLNPNTTQGTADRLQLKLANLPLPANGKSYYVWLLNGNGNNTDTQPILLASSDRGGEISTTYQGNAQHTNLLASYSRILITEEDNASPPDNPSLDPQTHRYGAEFINIIPPGENPGYGLVAHFRHLLAQDPTLAKNGLTGGLDTWLFRNTLKILETAGSIRDTSDANFIQRQLVRILDYLDGSAYIKTENIPANLAPVEIDPVIAGVPILTTDPQQSPPGYLKHIGTHLLSITVSPGVTSKQKQLAIQIDNAINNVQGWMDKVHVDAQKLLQLPSNQLTQPQAVQLLDDLFTQANNALVGQTDPNTNQVKEGVIQIHYNIQRLATFELASCHGNSGLGCE
jgi:eukaryotic-like serine/threonine-protein kinase